MSELQPMLDLTLPAEGEIHSRQWLIRADLITQVVEVADGDGKPGSAIVHLEDGRAIRVVERPIDIRKQLDKMYREGRL